jgi:hypothetical protein
MLARADQLLHPEQNLSKAFAGANLNVSKSSVIICHSIGTDISSSSHFFATAPKEPTSS